MQALTLLRVYLKKSTQRADDTIHSKSKEIEITVLVYSTARKKYKVGAKPLAKYFPHA